MLGCLRINFRIFDAQVPTILVKLDRPLSGDLTDGFLFTNGFRDDLVVDVGEVHDLLDLPTSKTQCTTKQIFEQKRPEIPEVRRVVDRWSARVHANCTSISRRERFYLARKRVVESKLWHARAGSGSSSRW